MVFRRDGFKTEKMANLHVESDKPKVRRFGGDLEPVHTPNIMNKLCFGKNPAAADDTHLNSKTSQYKDLFTKKLQNVVEKKFILEEKFRHLPPGTKIVRPPPSVGNTSDTNPREEKATEVYTYTYKILPLNLDEKAYPAVQLDVEVKGW